MTYFIVTSAEKIEEVSEEYQAKEGEIIHQVEDIIGITASDTFNYFDIQNNHPYLPNIVEWSQERIDAFEAEILIAGD